MTLIPDRAELQQRVASKTLRPLGDSLREALFADNPPRPGHAKQQALLSALEHPDVRFVVTGQQLGVYGGPLLTLYKALHAIKLARELSVAGGPPVVPLFWLQGEDHDIEEIASITLPAALAAGDPASDAELLERIHFDVPSWVGEERRRSVAGLALPEEADQLSSRLISQLPKLEGHCWLEAAVRSAYHSGANVLTAFRELFDAILGEEAVLYLNPQLPAVRQGAISINRLALSRYLEIGERLIGASVDAQVHVRARSPLFFFHPQGAGGPRYRLEAHADGEHFQMIGGSAVVDAKDLRDAVEAGAGAISASALLRPLIQDSLLPSVCYIGGQAEVRYFEQVALIAPLLDAPPPKIVPRARFLLIDAKAARLQKQLGVATSELLQPFAEVQRSMTERALGESPAAIFSRMRTELDAALFAPTEIFKKLDGEAEQLLRRTQDKVMRAIDGLEERISRSSAASFSRDAGRLRRVHALLRPTDQPQERVLAAVWFAAQNGPGFATSLLKRLDPLSIADREEIIELSEL